MDHAESLAQRVFTVLISGARLEYRVDQNRGQHDFDLILPDGTRAALEVTSAVDAETGRTHASIHSRRKGGPMIPARACRKGWEVMPEPGANINRIRMQVDEYLASIEATGRERFHIATGWQEPSVVRIHQDLRIESGWVVAWKSARQIAIGLPMEGGMLDATSATDAALAEARKLDNRRKLAAAGTDRRYLAVYVYGTNPAPWTALVNLDPPHGRVTLPSEISDLVLYAETGTPRQIVVWHATSDGPWLRDVAMLP